MPALVELVNIHGHRIYVSTDHIRRLEPRGEDPHTTLVTYSAGDSERAFEVEGYIDDIADFLNEQMR
ncbi:ATP-dependent DNA helicase RuvA [Kingella kingae]|uniref:Crossover junction ATP-dependent DNA helicase RuvA n=2 Tax=Kingella kingae TaxID=504 RepID=F5S7M9_KINKI|nr:hypothetical protein [Kingella kingae]EGK08883.1 crossover junction ATP-dependent DNA helicase RuvA [Kingella kingae ATCC 23330]EIC14614.1 hypothetical protein KKB_00100 [Kingella kingae PYKK081]MBD3614535.1 ATP-dependent DNA helicase RuvA [Kingella kingae]MBD3632868.1 ATP-dependent DNA helicase RuvA [Kingella kingae]MBD3660177.1 ATP-dependent DNA helicase RuvA [Kingella kingae]